MTITEITKRDEAAIQRVSFIWEKSVRATHLFLTEDEYQAALLSQKRREIKIKKCAHVIEGHILYVKKKRRK